MNTVKLLLGTALATALISAGTAQVPPSEFDFVHVPGHTVELKGNAISGRPDNMKLKGYYIFKDGDHFVLLSHRPDEEGNTFIASAFLDKGRFGLSGIVDRTGNDDVSGEGRNLHWNLQTHWKKINGVTFRVQDARYVVINLNDDVKQGVRLPVVFVGHEMHRYRSGSGYVLIDLLQ